MKPPTLDKALHGLSKPGTGKPKKVIDLSGRGKIKAKG